MLRERLALEARVVADQHRRAPVSGGVRALREHPAGRRRADAAEVVERVAVADDGAPAVGSEADVHVCEVAG